MFYLPDCGLKYNVLCKVSFVAGNKFRQDDECYECLLFAFWYFDMFDYNEL